MNRKQYLYLLILHIVLAYFSVLSSLICTIWGLLFIFWGIYRILKTGNANNEALMLAAYMVGLEVILRMNKGLLFYETGKYVVTLFLMLGLFVEVYKKKFPTQFIVYLLVLIPAITVIEYESFNEGRKFVLFTLSGPICLAATVFYCYQRNITFEEVLDLMKVILLPVFAIGIILFFKTPDLETIQFTTESNSQTSGGFGPNQVSTVIGLGLFVIGLSYVIGISVTGYPLLDILVLFMLTFRGFLTFSRGGLLAAAAAVFVAFIVSLSVTHTQSNVMKKMFLISVLSIISFIAWFYVNQTTRGLLETRYIGSQIENPYEEEDLTSGRLDILKTEVELFFRFPVLGAGVGMGEEYRKLEADLDASSHTEFTRLIAEHGLYGFVALIILFFSPLVHFFKIEGVSKIFCVAFVVLSFLTMFHAAMRIALPGFIYGLSFLIITMKDDSIHRK